MRVSLEVQEDVSTVTLWGVLATAAGDLGVINFV